MPKQKSAQKPRASRASTASPASPRSDASSAAPELPGEDDEPDDSDDPEAQAVEDASRVLAGDTTQARKEKNQEDEKLERTVATNKQLYAPDAVGARRASASYHGVSTGAQSVDDSLAQYDGDTLGLDALAPVHTSWDGLSPSYRG